MNDRIFKRCGACGFIWKNDRDFIFDDRVHVLWLQVIPGHPDANCIIFEHRGCGSTISVLTPKLRHWLPERFDYRENLYGTDKCNAHCNTRETMAACEKKCVNAQDRELVRMFIALKDNE